MFTNYHHFGGKTTVQEQWVQVTWSVEERAMFTSGWHVPNTQLRQLQRLFHQFSRKFNLWQGSAHHLRNCCKHNSLHNRGFQSQLSDLHFLAWYFHMPLLVVMRASGGHGLSIARSIYIGMSAQRAEVRPYESMVMLRHWGNLWILGRGSKM